jgi:hypothetical protein
MTRLFSIILAQSRGRTGRPNSLPAVKQLVHLKQDETDESKQEGYEHR